MIQVCIFATIALFIIIFIGLRIFVGDSKLLSILLQLLPFVGVYYVQYISNIIFARLIFLQRSNKTLAIDNLKAYSIFIYFNFFIECFVG